MIIVAAQVVIAFFGHNLVHVFERYAFPVLAVVFLITTVGDAGQVASGRARPARLRRHHGRVPARLGAAFGYAVGWNPYAADYTRYFPPDASKRAVGCVAGLRGVRVLRDPGDRRRRVGER